MSLERRMRQFRKELDTYMVNSVRETWRALAVLPFRERLRLAWRLLTGNTEMKKGGK